MAKKPTPYTPITKLRSKKTDVPLPPATPTHIPVRKKDGTVLWRRRRGTVTPATLNPVLAAMAKHKKSSMAAAARLIIALNPFTCNRYEERKFDTYSRNAQRFAGLFTKSIMQDGKMGWSFFDRYELNPNCKLEQLISGEPQLLINNKTASVKFPMHDNMVNKLRNLEATHFYFELILVSGNPAEENSLRTEHDISPEYPYMSHAHFDKDGKKQYCELSLILPDKKPYILIFKAATLDGRFNSGPNHEGLKVVGWG